MSDLYHVEGMSCASCASRVQKAAQAVPGVTDCSVSLLEHQLRVEGDVDPSLIEKAVQTAGYGCNAEEKGNVFEAGRKALQDTETPKLKKRLMQSLLFLAALMILSMGMMNVHDLSDQTWIYMGSAQALLALSVLIVNRDFFTKGIRALKGSTGSMDTLVAMGSGISFVYSLVLLVQMILKPELAMHLYHGLYFESAAMIPALITFGKMLEARSKGKTGDAIRSLLQLAPETAVVLQDGVEHIIPASSLQVGSRILIRPGQKIPADGVLIEGSGSVDESALTGESVPREVGVHDTVHAAGLNTNGTFVFEARKVSSDTDLARIIQLVREAGSSKAKLSRLADRISAIFVPSVLGLALLTVVGWLLAGQSFAYALTRGISVLVISCPCALGLATPVAIMVTSGVGAKRGILFKTAESMEAACTIDCVVLDKTGTITEGHPSICSMEVFQGDEEEFITKIVSLETPSDHPFARAVRQLDPAKAQPVTQFTQHPQGLVSAVLNGHMLKGGSLSAMSPLLDASMKQKGEQLAREGQTPLFFAEDDQILGVLGARDPIKKDSAEAVAAMKKRGIEVVLLSGDRKEVAKSIAEEAGVDHVVAQVLPDEKGILVQRLKEHGLRVMMIGDGINDAVALKEADLGVAIGTGTDVAVDSADIVLMNSSLMDAVHALRLSSACVRTIKQDLFWAFFYNLLCIPLAAGLFGWNMNPMVAASAMCLSSLTVVGNALRLNRVDLKKENSSVHSENRIEEEWLKIEKEEIKMKKTIEIEGMMCGHCEASVKKALEAVEGVCSADVSKDRKNAIVECTEDVDPAVLKKAVEDKDFTVVGIR